MKPLFYCFILFPMLLCGSTLQQLEEEIETLKEERSTLALWRLDDEVGALGARSQFFDTPDAKPYIEILLEKPERIDEIILIPSVRNDHDNGIRADYFPKNYEVTVFKKSGERSIRRERSRRVGYAEITPIIIPVNEEDVLSVRVTATVMERQEHSPKYAFGIAEICLFQGDVNIALHQEVKHNLGEPESLLLSRGLSPEYVVDGLVPYYMEHNQEKGTEGVVTVNHESRWHIYDFRLKKPSKIDYITIHNLGSNRTFPRAYSGKSLSLRRLTIHGNLDTNAYRNLSKHMLYRREYFESQKLGSLLPVPIHSNEEVQYLKFRILGRFDHKAPSLLGISEIEVYRNGENILKGVIPTCENFSEQSSPAPLSYVTDGKNYHGKVISSREWFHQLARRTEIERTLPHLIIKRNKIVKSQRILLIRASSVLAGLTLLGGALIIYLRYRHKRTLKKLKEELAINLHDEVSGNLHVIGFLSDKLHPELLADKDALMLVQTRIRELTERTGNIISGISSSLEESGVYNNVIADMQRISQKIMADYDQTFHVEGEEIIRQLKQKPQIHLFLFYKEALVNVLKHSDATAFQTRLTADRNSILLEVIDNGSIKEQMLTPSTLSRRAKILKGNLNVKALEEGGIMVNLKLNNPKYIQVK